MVSKVVFAKRRRVHGFLAVFVWLFAVTASGQSPPLRIMPLGDSITYGAPVPGGYRAPLYRVLTNAGYRVDFVGTQIGNSVASLPDPDHEGYGGWRIRDIDSIILNVLNTVATPDFILLLLGTNDYGSDDQTSNATNRLEALIAKMATARPSTRIVVANLLARNEPFDTQIQATFNPFLPGICERQRAMGRKVFFHDLRAAVPLSDMPDQLHPNQLGYNKMATNWFAAIKTILENEAGPDAIAAEADAYVRDDSSLNFGSAPILSILNGPNQSEAYIRFPLTNVFGPVLEATLRLSPVEVAGVASHSIAVAANMRSNPAPLLWGENSLSWDSRPTSGEAITNWTIATMSPVEINLTEAIRSATTNDGRISFRLSASSGAPLVSYASREQPNPYGPRLVVVTSNTPPTLSAFTDQIIAKNSSGTFPFTIADREKPASMLAVSAVALNSNLFPRTNIMFTGAGTERLLTLIARSNQLGSSTILVTVSDGRLSQTNGFVVKVEGSNNPPAGVNITSPALGARFSAPASVPLAANFFDVNGNVERIDYLLGNAIIGTSTVPPFSALWTNVPAGLYGLRAVVTDGGGLSATSQVRQVSVENTMTLVAAGASWKYFDVNGVDLGDAWRGTNFNDATWPLGSAKLGFGDPAVTEVDDTPSRITTYFRHSFFVPENSSLTNLTLSVIRDDGAVVYLNSNEVFRSNMPGGIITNGTLALSSISGAEEETWYVTNRPAAPLLKPGVNVLAVEVHQGRVDSSDLGFNLTLVGQSPTVLPAPITLAVQQTSNETVFFWPADGGWNLYSARKLGPEGVWTRIDTGITTVAGLRRFTVSPGLPSQFFQLRRP